jgi:hypothetical protein
MAKPNGEILVGVKNALTKFADKVQSLCYLLMDRRYKVRHLIVDILNNPVCLGILSGALIMVPIIGISKIHETKK